MPILGKLSPATANTDMLLYRVPAGKVATFDLHATNRSSGVARYRFALVAANDMSIQSVGVTAAGSGYQNTSTITITGENSNAATATIASLLLVGATIASGGTGYSVNDILTVSPGTRSVAATLRVDAVGAGGAVTAVSIVEAGTYTVTTTASTGVATTVGAGSGSGATFNLSWGIRAVTVSAGGNGYKAVPTLTVSGGSGAVLTPVMTQVVQDDDFADFDNPLPIADKVKDRISLGAGEAIFVRSDVANAANFFAIGFEEVA